MRPKTTTTMLIKIFSIIILVFFVFVAPIQAADQSICDHPANPIVAENCKPGTNGWRITRRLGDIEGFASATSLNPGETIKLYINTTGPEYDLFIYRSGYYSGTGGRLMHEAKGIRGQAQPTCQTIRSTGLVSCSNWSTSYELTIPAEWISGVYLVKLVRSDSGGENFIHFIVREDQRSSDILTQLSVTTYLAYNPYGDKSAYSSLSWDYCPTVADAPRAVKVSFDRPNSWPPVFQNSYFWTDYPLIFWLKSQGYDVTYQTNIDTHRSGKPSEENFLLDHRTFLSSGHDEYWSQEMRDAVTSARDAGVHLGIFIL